MKGLKGNAKEDFVKNYLKNIVVAAVIGFAVGAALSFALPTLATWAGVEVSTAVGAMSSPAWLGLFAGGWGALGAALTPPISYVFNAIFSGKAKAQQDITSSIPAQTITNGIAEGLDLNAKSGRYQDGILAERAQKTECNICRGA